MSKILKPHRVVARLDGGVEITAHALEQYRTRYDKAATEEKAIENIRSLLYRCHRGNDTIKGDKVLIPDDLPDARFVFREDKVCVTVLPAHAAEKDFSGFDSQIWEYIEENPDNYLKYCESLAEEKKYVELKKCAADQNVIIESFKKEIEKIESEVVEVEAKLTALRKEISIVGGNKGILLGRRDRLMNAIMKMTEEVKAEIET